MANVNIVRSSLWSKPRLTLIFICVKFIQLKTTSWGSWPSCRCHKWRPLKRRTKRIGSLIQLLDQSADQRWPKYESKTFSLLLLLRLSQFYWLLIFRHFFRFLLLQTWTKSILAMTTMAAPSSGPWVLRLVEFSKSWPPLPSEVLSGSPGTWGSRPTTSGTDFRCTNNIAESFGPLIWQERIIFRSMNELISHESWLLHNCYTMCRLGTRHLKIILNNRQC